jgi:hypothetical protein
VGRWRLRKCSRIFSLNESLRGDRPSQAWRDEQKIELRILSIETVIEIGSGRGFAVDFKYI